MTLIIANKGVSIVEHEGEIYKRITHPLVIAGEDKTFYTWLKIKTWGEAPNIGLEVLYQKIGG